MIGTGYKRPALRGWRLSTKLLLVSWLVTVLGFSAICASVLLDMRRGEEELARQTSENLASTIDADISRNIEIYDLSLRAVATNLVSPEIESLSRELRHLILFDHAATARHFGAIQVFDATGKLTIDASTLDPLPTSSEDEEFFKIHRDNADMGLFISRPMLHRGVYSVVLSRRINGSDGRFVGVVAGAIRFSYFHDLFGRLRLGAADTITVMRHDGIIIMRTPFDLDAIGKDLSQSPVARQALQNESGAMSSVSTLDGIARLFVWRDNTKPLIVVVGKPWSSIYRIWQTQALRIAAIMLVLIGMMSGVTIFLAREISRRAHAEESLEELATTDALTGLRNRRKFDSLLAQEWRRAERNHSPVALLMIDADHFKSYNDRFGHQAGDQALRAISTCIGAVARRAGDCAARYGGEEFAVLLPGLDAASAVQAAEAIRHEVTAWSGGSAQLTVSIGVASLTPVGQALAASLFQAADKALYAAKADGRNRSRLAQGARVALAA